MSKEVNWQQECLKKGFECELGSFENPHLCAAILELIADNERNERMLLAACVDMGAIGEALGADMNSDGEEMLSMVVEMKAEREALLAERDALRSALERFYNANQARLKLLSREVYLDMQRLPGMRDALYEMDDAQHQAYAALQGAQP